MGANSAIELLAKKKGFETLTALALAMGKKPATFFNNLKYFSEHPNFNSKFGIKLKETLKVSQNDLEQIFSVSIASPKETQTSALLNQMVSGSNSRNKEGYFLLLKVLGSLEKGDKVIRCCAVRPIEYDDTFLQKKIGEAILRGVLFIYLFPAGFSTGFSQTNERRSTLFREFRIFRDALMQVSVSENDLPPIEKTTTIFAMGCSSFRANDPIFLNQLHSYWSIYTQTDNQTYVLEESTVGSPNLPMQSVSVLWNVMPFIQAQKVGQYIQSLAPEAIQNVVPEREDQVTLVTKSKNVAVTKTYVRESKEILKDKFFGTENVQLVKKEEKEPVKKKG